MNNKMKYRGLIFLLFIVFLTGTTFCTSEAEPTVQEKLEATSTDVLSEITESPDRVTPTRDVTLTPPQTRPPVAGIEMHSIDDKGGLDLVVDSGVSWIRRNALMWSEIEPAEGDRNWEAVAGLEKELINAAENKLDLILIVRSAPAWAQKEPGYYCGPVLPDKLGAFADFMHDVVQRYSASPYNVKYWEFGNEPDVPAKYVAPDNIFGCWGDPDSEYYGGEYYAEMLKVVYPKVKSADPQSKVLVGGLLMDCDPVNPPEKTDGSGQIKDCTSSLFLEGILKNGGGSYFDGVSFHGYDFYFGSLGKYGNLNWNSTWDTTGPLFILKAEYIRNLLSSYEVNDKELFNSEAGLICGSTGKEAVCQTEEFSKTKAYYLVQGYASSIVEELDAYIWYSVRGWRASGLVSGSLQPYPAYNALTIATSKLEETAFIREVTDFPGVKVYEFEREGNRVWVVWSLDGEEHTIRFPSMPDDVVNVFGESMEYSDEEVTVTVSPLYIEWKLE